MVGLPKATGFNVPPLVLGATWPCAARDSTPQIVPDGARVLVTLLFCCGDAICVRSAVS